MFAKMTNQPPVSPNKAVYKELTVTDLQPELQISHQSSSQEKFCSTKNIE